ncbi:hypothetical protein EVAR_74385_1 [Eumeta japonica]|uniref:Uncharacterized protein n=1 Tax=Eumeta variegata TaxID=151549 RepID=A0A4C1SDC1_EUMVA|nr:hypothetical protein EVAR_74385_1 [Eumeta japonica]
MQLCAAFSLHSYTCSLPAVVGGKDTITLKGDLWAVGGEDTPHWSYPERSSYTSKIASKAVASVYLLALISEAEEWRSEIKIEKDEGKDEKMEIEREGEVKGKQ